jgi:hypothetical protein
MSENLPPDHGEHHHKHEYHLEIDHRPYEWPHELIDGREIKVLAGVDPKDYTVWEVVPGLHDDIEIKNDEKVELKGHKKKFIVGKKHSTEGAGHDDPPEL